MEFRILGPVEVLEEGRPLPLASGRQRALLGVLLLHANEVLPRERLIEELWGAEPPDSAVKALQVHVSQLRKTLGREGAARRLRTRGRGYEFDVEPDQVDLHKFERLVEEGRKAQAAGDRAQAAAMLREALALWRGAPFADVPAQAFARPELARLEELRLAVLEERIDADLVIGRHADVVPELEGLVTRYPLRERLRAQLMLALYRCGRQAEALETYQEGRRALVEEVGLEPGRELRELEQAILRQDPALDTPA
jgi:DNA-binding SARP family transcriptional activator